MTAAAADTGLARWHAEWLVTFGPRGCAPAGAQAWTSGSTTLALSSADGSVVQVAASDRVVAIFSGVLVNAPELQPGATLADAARIVGARFDAQGERAFEDLRGPFAAIVWDRAADRLYVARDQVGIEPLFYARQHACWYWSPSPHVLVRQPGVSADPDAVALAEWLCGWFPASEDTAYRDVKRVRPATRLVVSGLRMEERRYWDPWPEGAPVAWIGEEDAGAIDPLLDRAVDRTLRAGASAIFLSGGVDSIAVAAAAADLQRARGGTAPQALSLTFPDERSNEQPIQEAVAAHLGLAQELVGLVDAAGAEGLVSASLALSAGWPQPLWNVWTPAYGELARRASMGGREVVLTGRGGDEWFTVTPYLLADLLRGGHAAEAWRFLRMRSRSEPVGGARGVARLLWTTAGRSLASATLDAIAPAAWHARRRRRLLSERPPWVAPDPAVRKAMDDRVERWMDAARPEQGFYVREARTALRHPAVTHDMEETQEFGRRYGLRMLHPFWDVDLVSLLARVPPRMLTREGRSKWFLRRRLTARFPGLGLERRVKVDAGHVFRAAMARESAAALARLGGPKSLARAGAVGLEVIESGGRPKADPRWGGPGRLWSLLTLETWVRHRERA
jgi:asparagine synthase (glutamine-hydrolysing)